MAKKRLRISGTVTYMNEKNQRLAIPTGHHEFDADAGEGGTIYWKDNNGIEHLRPLTLVEYAQYVKNKDMVELEE
jgi:hypothetical protein